MNTASNRANIVIQSNTCIDQGESSCVDSGAQDTSILMENMYANVDLRASIEMSLNHRFESGFYGVCELLNASVAPNNDEVSMKTESDAHSLVTP